MCGIIGTTDQRDHGFLPRMLDLMIHRGPDDSGQHIDVTTGVALAMRRLSILDLASGHQPMTNEDETIWIVFNGEIYNAPELRRELEAQGHRFRTKNSDTEVLVHLYEECGQEMVTRLNGMFAFVIYDARSGTLFGARDRVGVKPLYYASHGSRFAFASELKCLTALPWVSREIDGDSLSHYLSLQFVPAPNSILRDVKKLPAGYRFHYDLSTKNLQVDSYWHLCVRPNPSLRRDEFIEQLRAKLVESVRRQTLSDVPIACSVSGGLDSAAVAGIVAQHHAGPVRTYSVGFSGSQMERYDELPLARKVAEKWGTEHREILVEPTQLLRDLERMVHHLDEPYGGGLPSWYVYEAVGRDCKVVLTGTGGDELFGNYQKWKLYERNLFQRSWHVLKQCVRWRRPSLVYAAVRHPRGFLYHNYLPDAVKTSILPSRARTSPSRTTAGLMEETWKSAGVGNPRDAVACIDFQMQLPEEFLAVTDRFSMAHSVEARVPFLDHELVELAFAVPAHIRTRRGDAKYLAREVVRPFLPPELLNAPKKGFVLPLMEWTRKELRPVIESVLSPAALSQQGLLSPQAWVQVVQPHLTGQRDFTQQVWTLLMFQLWHNSMQNVSACVPAQPYIGSKKMPAAA